jgi:hypothetical protein
MASGLTRGSGQARKPPPRPIPQDIIDFGNRYSLAQRIQCLTLITEGFSSAGIERKTGVKERLQRNIKKAQESDPRILEYYVAGGERSGRPKEISDEVEEGLLANVRGSRSGISQASCISVIRLLTHANRKLRCGLGIGGWAVPRRGWALFSHPRIESFSSLLSIPPRQHLYIGYPQNLTCQLVYGDMVYITEQNSWSAVSQTSRSQPCNLPQPKPSSTV